MSDRPGRVPPASILITAAAAGYAANVAFGAAVATGAVAAVVMHGVSS